MKATFNIKTKEFTVKGKGIYTLKTVIDHEWEDYWDSVNSKKTGEAIYDINLFFDDLCDDNMDVNNPKNYSAQYVNLIRDKNGDLTVGYDYVTMPMKVSTGKFNPNDATFHVKNAKGVEILKTKRLNNASDARRKHKGSTIVAIDSFGYEKKLK